MHAVTFTRDLRWLRSRVASRYCYLNVAAPVTTDVVIASDIARDVANRAVVVDAALSELLRIVSSLSLIPTLILLQHCACAITHSDSPPSVCATATFVTIYSTLRDDAFRDLLQRVVAWLETAETSLQRALREKCGLGKVDASSWIIA